MSCKLDFQFQFLKFKRRATSLALSHSLIHYLSASATMKTAYKSYSVAFKLEAISTAKRTSNRSAARLCKVDVKRIREWRKNELQLRAVANPGRAHHLPGGGRPIKCVKMEEALVEWISTQRQKSLRVTRKAIQCQAKQLMADDSFQASDGWLCKFLRRNRLTLRKRTTITQKQPDDVKEKVINYLLFVEGLRKNCNYRTCDIGAADETAVSFDPVANSTIEKVGAKRVPLLSTGHLKSKVTVMLAAKADGRKLKPFIVLKGKRIPKELTDFRDGEIFMSESGWMTENATIEWVRKIWASFSFGRRLISWDAFRCHRMPSVKRELKKLRTDIAMIPSGCTGLLQAPDVSWIKPFKASYALLHEKWMNTVGCSEKNFTDAGNPRSPSKLEICQWIVKAWNSVCEDVIKRSFETCGLSVPLDGHGDCGIHAVKELDILSDLKNRRLSIPAMDIEDEVSSSDESLCSDI